MKSIVILYHNDEDGFGAAWAAWKKFKNRASYIPVEYKNRAAYLEKLKNKEIYLLDLCFDGKIMKKLLGENKKLVVIDHHIGRKEDIKISTEYIYNLNCAGCVLAWKYFFPKKSIPKLLIYIEDMDIWKWRKPFSKEINAFLEACDFNFKEWDKFSEDFNNRQKFNKYIEAGKAILKYKNVLTKKLVQTGENVIFEGYQTVAVNSPIFNSEIGHLISNRKGIGIVWSYENGRLLASLRSNGKIDVSKIAKKFRGGGHKASSGFDLPVKIKFPWKRIKI